MNTHTLRQWASAAALVLTLSTAWAQGQEAAIRKALSERLPQMPKIEEITATPLAGIYELRLDNNEIYYSDAAGNYLIQGSLIDTKSRRNLTEEREAKLNAIDFKLLPLKDAITLVHGNGSANSPCLKTPTAGFANALSATWPRSTT